MDYLTRILNAKVYDVAKETSLVHAQLLSARVGNKVLIKREDEQPVFSFKLRGAYNKMAHLPANQLAAGVVAASSGNHAQGVALAAQKLGVDATIVMPSTTPTIKIDAVRARGAKVILHGESYSDAYEHARRWRGNRRTTHDARTTVDGHRVQHAGDRIRAGLFSREGKNHASHIPRADRAVV